MKTRHRDDKRQIMSFIPLSTKVRLRNICLNKMKTYQELAAEGINLYMKKNNIIPFMSDPKKKISLRHKGLAKPKTEEQTTQTRIGKVTFGGWYKIEMIKTLENHCQNLETTVQEVLEEAAKLVIEKYEQETAQETQI